MKRQFQTVDVFTDRKFGGNPLAVFPDAEGLSTEQMQNIAAEFNYAETTFVLPPKDPGHTAHVRIFTPKAEMPFAGHPNVGTTFVLARLGKATGKRLVFEEKAGLVVMDLTYDGGTVMAARLAAPQPFSLGETIAPEDDGRLLYQKLWWKEMVVMARGPLVNVLIAAVLFTGLFPLYGSRVPQTTISAVAGCGRYARFHGHVRHSGIPPRRYRSFPLVGVQA